MRFARSARGRIAGRAQGTRESSLIHEVRALRAFVIFAQRATEMASPFSSARTHAMLNPISVIAANVPVTPQK
jgi:hypothetical protein